MSLRCALGRHDWEEGIDDIDDGRPLAHITPMTGPSLREVYRMRRECRRCGARQRGVAWVPTDTWRYGSDVRREWR